MTGLLEGDSLRRNTAIALTPLKLKVAPPALTDSRIHLPNMATHSLKVVPHETFRVMLRSDPLLKVHRTG